MANLTLKSVVKRYGDVTVVKDFNLEVEDREFIVLVGPSGCGKSTTLRMIAGLEEISEGTLSIDGKVMNDVPPKDRDIAMVFQSYALYPHMSVYENMAFGLRLRKYPGVEIDKRVRHAADILGIADYLERKPKALSGGQRQRVAMGRAIVREPKVFLFDEPLSNLDAKLRVQMRAEISRLHRELKATSIYVTHDQTEAMTLATRIVVLKDGHIQQVGAPLELYQQPANRFVGGFIGSPSMNFLTGTVDASGRVLKGPGFSLPLKDLPQVAKGSEICIGIRPEGLHLHGSGAGEGSIEATVDFMEPMGAELFAYFKIEGVPAVGRFSPEAKFQVGQTVKLSIDPSVCHLFDPKTDLAIR